MLGARNGPWREEAPVGQRHRVAGDPVGYKHGMQGRGGEGRVARAAHRPEGVGSPWDAGNGPVPG